MDFVIKEININNARSSMYNFSGRKLKKKHNKNKVDVLKTMHPNEIFEPNVMLHIADNNGREILRIERIN